MFYELSPVRSFWLNLIIIIQNQFTITVHYSNKNNLSFIMIDFLTPASLNAPAKKVNLCNYQTVSTVQFCRKQSRDSWINDTKTNILLKFNHHYHSIVCFYSVQIKLFRNHEIVNSVNNIDSISKYVYSLEKSPWVQHWTTGVGAFRRQAPE